MIDVAQKRTTFSWMERSLIVTASTSMIVGKKSGTWRILCFPISERKTNILKILMGNFSIREISSSLFQFSKTIKLSGFTEDQYEHVGIDDSSKERQESDSRNTPRFYHC